MRRDSRDKAPGGAALTRNQSDDRGRIEQFYMAKKIKCPEDKWLCSTCGDLYTLDVRYWLVGRQRKVCKACVVRCFAKVLEKGEEVFGLVPMSANVQIPGDLT